MRCSWALLFVILAVPSVGLAEGPRTQRSPVKGHRDGVIVVGADGRVLHADASSARLLGGNGAPAGRPLSALPLPQGLLGMLKKAGRGKPLQTEIEAAPGRRLSVATHPLGSGGGYALVLRDVTAARRTERARREFLGTLAHELRTPVTVFQGTAELLREGTLAAHEQPRFIDALGRHADRMVRLVDDLATLTDDKAHPSHQLARQPVPLRTLLGQVRETAHLRAAKRGTTVSVDLADDLVALGDGHRLEQALDNLVGNAVKYGKEGGRVTIRGQRRGRQVVVEVSDDGPGIDKSHLPHLFDRFYRVDPARSRALGGSGLGLAVVKDLVEGMGGRVEVESQLGAGTTFRVALPAARGGP